MENSFVFGQGRINYYDKGIGDPIVLLHGYLETAEIWNSFSMRLSKNFRVISVDLPGHGLSDKYEQLCSMEFMAAIVKKLLDTLGIERAFITGHSLGGYITLAFLEHYPEKLSGYCLFHSHPFSDSPEAIEKREREIIIVEAGKKEIMYPENITRMFAESNLVKFREALFNSREIASGIPGDSIIAVLKGMIARPSRVSFMEQGALPCLWILGAMDNYIPCDVILKKVTLPANAEVVILNESGHLGFVEEEERSVEVISNFVKRLKCIN